MTLPDASLNPLVGVVDLLRHGKVQGGACFRGSTDDPLTVEGWQTMERAANALSPPWQQITSSPLLRCRLLAETLSRKHATALQVEAGFREICFGEWEGRRADEILASDGKRLTQFWQDPERYSPPGGETMADFKKRVLRAWYTLIDGVDGTHQLLITHGGVVRVILADLLGLSMMATFALELPWASVTRIHLVRSLHDPLLTPQLAFLGEVG
ncbi:MAG: histidine phosphatase family protein [Magnetococcales bacterium]|nr:histidine phosphatase family protein [Magnetococcales bacterium]